MSNKNDINLKINNILINECELLHTILIKKMIVNLTNLFTIIYIKKNIYLIFDYVDYYTEKENTILSIISSILDPTHYKYLSLSYFYELCNDYNIPNITNIKLLKNNIKINLSDYADIEDIQNIKDIKKTENLLAIFLLYKKFFVFNELEKYIYKKKFLLKLSNNFNDYVFTANYGLICKNYSLYEYKTSGLPYISNEINQDILNDYIDKFLKNKGFVEINIDTLFINKTYDNIENRNNIIVHNFCNDFRMYLNEYKIENIDSSNIILFAPNYTLKY